MWLRTLVQPQGWTRYQLPCPLSEFSGEEVLFIRCLYTAMASPHHCWDPAGGAWVSGAPCNTWRWLAFHYNTPISKDPKEGATGLWGYCLH